MRSSSLADRRTKTSFGFPCWHHFELTKNMSEFGLPFWVPFWGTFRVHFGGPFRRPLWSLGNPVGRVWDSRGTPFWVQMVDPPKNCSWTTFSSQNLNF